MAEFAELALEGVPLVTEHYDKVYDPIKDKTKQGFRKVKEMRDRRNGGTAYESESEEYEYDGPPPRRSTTGGGRRRSPRDDGGRRRSGRYDDGSVVEERYAYRGPPSGARAKSVGRSGGRDSRRGGGNAKTQLPNPLLYNV